jgi:hypothetical protein
MKMCVGMVTILSIWWSPDRFRHLHHVEFDVKFIFFLKINEVTWKFGWNMSYMVTTRWVLFLSLLSLVSNSSSCWKFMQLHENMVELHPIWWPLDGFCSLAYWVWFQIQHFVENVCKLHEKMVEIFPIWWPPYVFWLSLV